MDRFKDTIDAILQENISAREYNLSPLPDSRYTFDLWEQCFLYNMKPYFLDKNFKNPVDTACKGWNERTVDRPLEYILYHDVSEGNRLAERFMVAIREDPKKRGEHYEIYRAYFTRSGRETEAYSITVPRITDTSSNNPLISKAILRSRNDFSKEHAA